MAVPCKEATMSYIKEIPPAPRPLARVLAAANFVRESPVSIGRRVFNERAITVFQDGRGPRTIRHPRARRRPVFTGRRAAARNTNQLKEQWCLQIPLSWTLIKRAFFFFYPSRLFPSSDYHSPASSPSRRGTGGGFP